MTIVLDNSVVVEWLVGGQFAKPAGELIQSRFDELWVPALFWSELVYVLGKEVGRGRMTRAYRDTSLPQVAALGIRTDSASALPGACLDRAIRLTDEYGLTIYDAVYLELALRLQGALATLDRALADATRAAGLKAALVI